MLVDCSKKKRHYTSKDKASLDIACDNDNIGIIVNLSQEINTIMWDRINSTGDWAGAMDAYYDNCLLSILSEIAIDGTKREYPLDCMEELRIVRAKYNDKDKDGRAIRPYFFAHVAKKKGFYDREKKFYKPQLAPMDYLQKVINGCARKGKRDRSKLCTIGDFIKDIEIDEKPRSGYVDLVISMIKELDANTRMLYNVKDDIVADAEEKRELSNNYFDKCVRGIKNLHINNATMRELLIRMDDPENSSIRRKMWTILFGAMGEELMKFLKAGSKPIYSLEECKTKEESDVVIFGLPFKKKLIS